MHQNARTHVRTYSRKHARTYFRIQVRRKFSRSHAHEVPRFGEPFVVIRRGAVTRRHFVRAENKIRKTMATRQTRRKPKDNSDKTKALKGQRTMATRQRRQKPKDNSDKTKTSKGRRTMATRQKHQKPDDNGDKRRTTKAG